MNRVTVDPNSVQLGPNNEMMSFVLHSSFKNGPVTVGEIVNVLLDEEPINHITTGVITEVHAEHNLVWIHVDWNGFHADV
jgi:hypothetical protein